MHLRQLRYTYSACAPFTKNKEKIKKIKETGDARYNYQNELDKVCFQHDKTYGDFKDLNRRTFADKVLLNKEFNIVKNPNYVGYQRRLASMVYNFFQTKSPGRTATNEIISDKVITEELRKAIIQIF